MIDDVSLTGIITRLRRQTRNPDTITVCDELERRLAGTRGEQRVIEGGGSFDRVRYQREYMRKRRAKLRS